MKYMRVVMVILILIVVGEWLRGFWEGDWYRLWIFDVEKEEISSRKFKKIYFFLKFKSVFFYLDYLYWYSGVKWGSLSVFLWC